MKLTARQIDSFMRAPDPQARVILVYGPDAGLVRERAQGLGKTVVKDLNDPFNAVTLTGALIQSDPARLIDEAIAMSMMGGNRLIRVEDAEDNLTPLLKDYLVAPSQHNLIIVEAGGLTARSPLRSLCEKSTKAAALPCYVDEGRSLNDLIREQLQQAGYNIEQDALLWLANAIGGDRQKVRMGLEKLILYMGPHLENIPKDQKLGTVRLGDAMASSGDAGAQDLDDLVQAVASARTADALRYYNQLLQEAAAPIMMLRALQNHFRRLHVTQGRLNNDMSLEEALKKLNPPVFFKAEDAFKSQLRRWPLPQLEIVLQRLSILEAQTKQTGTPSKHFAARRYYQSAASALNPRN